MRGFPMWKSVPISILEDTLGILEKCKSPAYMKNLFKELNKLSKVIFEIFIWIIAYLLITSFRSSLSTIPSRRRITRCAWRATSSS